MNGHAQTSGHAAASLVIGILPWLPASPVASPNRVPDAVLYCVPDTSGQWHLQPFAPLIDIHHHQRFVRFGFTGNWLRTARVRSFHESYELAFEYRFDTSGKLSARNGYVRKYGSWSAEADLFSVSGNPVAAPQVRYTRGAGLDIAEPEDGAEYVRNFDQVESFRTIDELPCAASLRVMEKN